MAATPMKSTLLKTQKVVQTNITKPCLNNGEPFFVKCKLARANWTLFYRNVTILGGLLDLCYQLPISNNFIFILLMTEEKS